MTDNDKPEFFGGNTMDRPSDQPDHNLGKPREDWRWSYKLDSGLNEYGFQWSSFWFGFGCGGVFIIVLLLIAKALIDMVV